jgi:hypothetical protein
MEVAARRTSRQGAPVRVFRRPGRVPKFQVSLLEVSDMSADDGDVLTQIIARHRTDVAAARAAADQMARDAEHARHDCEGPLRGVALPLLREWAKRLSVEGYPTTVEDRLGCRPASLIFRLAPRGGPASSLTLGCEAGPTVRFRMNVDGKDAGDDWHGPLAALETPVVLDGLVRFVAAALAAAIPRRSDCGP